MQEQHHYRLDCICCSSPRAQPHRRRRARSRLGGSGARAITGPGSRTCARKSRTARRSGRAAVPRKVRHRLLAWNRSSTRPSRPCASRSAASRCRSSPRSRCCRTPTARQAARRRRRPSAKPSTNLRPFALITNTLAKDKEISDRWPGFKTSPTPRHLSNRVEPEVVEALVSAVRAAYPKLSHRYYALKAKWFGRNSAHWDRNAPLPKVAQRTIPWSDARATVLTPMARSRRNGRIRRPLLRQLGSTRRCVKASAGRLRASDRALGASLRAAQLPGPAARRDDAGA